MVSVAFISIFNHTMPNAPHKPAQRIAAIDVGTNSFHMVVASVNRRGGLNVLSRMKEMVRLGSASTNMKVLTPDAIERGVATLVRFAAEAQRHDAEILAVATSAVREAVNKEVFVQRVLDATGIEVQVVSGAEEGRLIYLGAIHALPIFDKRTLVIDIGGGSTETIIGHEGEVAFVHSAKLGHVRLTTGFFQDGNPTMAQVEECRQMIRGVWTPVHQTLESFGFDGVVGCSGTIMSMAAITLARTHHRIPDNMSKVTLSSADLLETIAIIIAAKTKSGRATLDGLDAKRSDVILAGALILEQAILGLKIPSITLSSYALREGMVFDKVQKEKDFVEYHHLAHLRYQSVDTLCRQYETHRAHAEHVKDLSLLLFDGLQMVHGFGPPERELLEAAALLHDIGYFVDANQHHKHTEYIVRNSALHGFTNTEIEHIAAIARYHRKSHPKKKHPYFAVLSAGDKQMVSMLASILRIAEGLDRRRQQHVKNLTIQVSPNTIAVHVMSDGGGAEIEIWGAERRKGLMAELSGKNVVFVLEENVGNQAS